MSYTRRKPTKLKVVQGTDRRDRQVEQEPEYSAPVNIEPPSDLDGLALEQWQNKAPLLLESGVLTEVDLDALRGYCTAYKKMVEASAQTDEEGYTIIQPTGTSVVNPAFNAYIKASQEMRHFSSLLGLDPSSRARINVGKGKDGGNPFTDL